MKNFFTSDHHFFHANIIPYNNRPFSSMEEMNNKLIQNWNSVISVEDTVYHLGDFSFKGDTVIPILLRLNGKIHFILGNHDKSLHRFFGSKNYQTIGASNRGFHRLEAETKITIEGQRIILGHYPLVSWYKKAKGSYMLHGHVHSNLACSRKDGTSLGKILDVGVDGNNYKPYSFDEIKKIMDKKPIDAIEEFSDHHKRETTE